MSYSYRCDPKTGTCAIQHTTGAVYFVDSRPIARAACKRLNELRGIETERDALLQIPQAVIDVCWERLRKCK